MKLIIEFMCAREKKGIKDFINVIAVTNGSEKMDWKFYLKPINIALLVITLLAMLMLYEILNFKYVEAPQILEIMLKQRCALLVNQTTPFNNSILPIENVR